MRMVSRTAIGRYDWVLKSGDTAQKGFAAYADVGTGQVTVAPGPLPLGLFESPDMVGDGVLKATVRVWPSEIWATWWQNTAGPSGFTEADVFKLAYMDSQPFVTNSGTNLLGLVLDVGVDGVLVYTTLPCLPLAAPVGP